MAKARSTHEAEDAPYFEAAPPATVARGLAWLLLALFAVAVVLAAVVKLPETVSCGFVLVPLRGADPVRAPRAGVVTEVSAAESDAVAKGAKLFALRSPEQGDRSSELLTLEAQLRGGADSSANARRVFESESQGRREDLARLEGKLRSLEGILETKKEQLALTREQAERTRQLNEQGLASLNERSDTLLRHSQTRIELTQAEAERRETEAAIAQLRLLDQARRSEFQERERGLAERLEAARIRSSALSGELVGPSGVLLVKAPCDGTVVRITARGPGAVVAAGEVLGEVACSGERLRAELAVPQSGVAQLAVGEPVKLLYDAFPYQRYGVKRGNVVWASPAASTGESQTFRAFVGLEEQSVTVAGKPRPLLAGMKGTARVIVGRRSVMSHVVAPLRQLREATR